MLDSVQKEILYARVWAAHRAREIGSSKVIPKVNGRKKQKDYILDVMGDGKVTTADICRNLQSAGHTFSARNVSVILSELRRFGAVDRVELAGGYAIWRRAQ
ncbi:MAG: hypothetical protein AAGK79_17350 [Pseudomonadota bacterium]